MKIIEAVKLVKALHEIKDQSFNVKTSYSIAMLLRDCEPHVHFYMEKERELVNKFSDNLSADGKFSVKESDFSAFSEEKKELDELEIEIKIPEIVLPADLKVSPSAMNALLDYVRIEE